MPGHIFRIGIILLLLLLAVPTCGWSQETFLDTFSSVSYSNNNGTQNFSGDWIESGDGGSPSGGRIRITGGRLRFRDLDNRFIYRFVPLAGASAATLTLDYDASSIGNEELEVYIFNTDTSNWNLVSTISSGTGSISYTLTAAEIASNPAIILYRGDTSWSGSEEVFVDNVLFTATYGPILNVADITVNEDDGTATFTVTHAGANAGGAFTVNYSTADGTALAGSDYTGTSGTLNFNGTAGDTETIMVSLLDDGLFEVDETFTVSFTSASDPSVDITDTATATIVDDEVILNDVPLALYRDFSGNYDYTTSGGTFRTASNTTDPCAITTTSSGTVTSAIPVGATVIGAYLLWSHSNLVPDSFVTFEGQSVTADLVYGASFTGGREFYGYISDVTGIVSGIANPNTNTFDLTDLDIDTSSTYCGSATVLGAWSLMIFYEEASLPASTINLYYGFDITQNAGTSFTLDSFYAISPTGSKATFLSYEGDATLDGSSGGSTNPEELSITNQGGSNFILSGDGGQTGNNAYNSTIYDGPAGVNLSNIYGLDLDTYDISSFINTTDTQVTANVDVGQDLVISSAVAIRVPSNLISGTVFEDVNYPGGAGRNQASASGVGVEGATVEYYDLLGTLQGTTTSDANGDYAFGGMADGVYTVRVVNQLVPSSRGGGSSCGSCYAVQTFRTEYDGVSISEITDEVGGNNPSATSDANTGTLAGAQTTSIITIAGGGIGGIDFGFNFNTIVNTNEDGQGSLEQFVINSNNLDETGLDIEANAIFNPAAGEDVSIFMIPPTGDPLGRTADGGYNGSYFDIFISDGVDPTDITADNTHIDGRTQTAYSGDSNSGTIGSGGVPVGVAATALPNYDRPEMQIHRNSGDVIVNTGSANVVRNVSVYANNNAAIRMDGGALTIRNSLLGVDPTGANAGNIDTAVEVNGGDGNIIENYISTTTNQGVWVRNTTNLLVSQNHITGNGTANCGFNILIEGGTGISIQQNLIENAEAAGIEADASAGGLTISQNSITASGVDTACDGGEGGIGIRLGGSNSSLSGNAIYSNGNAGIVVSDGSGSGNLISQNAIYANGTTAPALGIDLDASGGHGDEVTLNDTNDSDTGPNGLSNFPVIATAYIQGANLVIKGWARPGAIMEFFFTDINEGTASVGDNQLGLSTDYGEGQTYIATVIEGSGADLDSGASNYTDMDGNTDTTNRFNVQIPLPPGTSLGEMVTATATLGGSTSEFAPMSEIKVRTIITNRRITYRVNQN